MSLDPYARKFWKTPGPYLSTGVCFLVFLPFLICYIKHQFAVLAYAHSSIAPIPPTLFDHFRDPIRFGLTQLFAIGLILIPLLPFLGFRWKWDWSRIWSIPESRFLTFFIFFPFIFHLCVAAYFGGRMRTALGCQLWVFLPVFLLYVIRFNAENQKAFRRSMILVFTNIFLFAVLSILIITLSPWVSGKGSRIHFPGRDLAVTVETIWRDRFHTPLPYIRGDDWAAQNVSVYASSRPKVFSPLWTTEEDFAKKGGILIWTIGSFSSPTKGDYGNLDFHYSPGTDRPDEWLKQFPNAEILPSIILPKKTRFDVPPAQIGVAIVPPSGMP
jgi:hypothetical protein